VRKLAAVLLAALTITYPLFVYIGFDRVPPAWIGFAVAMLVFLRAWTLRRPSWYLAAGGAAILALASAYWGGWLPLKLYPVLVNALLLAAFVASLVRGPSMIERLARLSEPNLSPEGVTYTRRVTQVWCAFFLVNGAAALVTALWASTAVWTLYNGLVAYLLMGLLFGAEWFVRRRVKAATSTPRVRHG